MTIQYGIAGAGLARVLILVAAPLGAYIALRRRGIDIMPLRRSPTPAKG